MPIQQSYQHTVLTPWMEAMNKQIAESSRDAASQAYVPYNNPRIAKMNDDIERSYKLSRDNVGVQAPYISRANTLNQRSSGQFRDNYENYMNPYIQHVVNQIGEQGGRHFRERLLPGLESAFVGLGHHGSTQHRDFAERASRDNAAEVASKQKEAMYQGYTHAAQQHGLERGQDLEAANQQMRLGQTASAANLGDVLALQSVGGDIQGRDQANLNVAHDEFLKQRRHPFEAVQQHSSILAGLPTQISTYSANNSQAPYIQQPMNYQPNTAAGIGSFASSLLGASMANRHKAGGSIKAPAARKKSGMIKHKPKLGAQSLAQSSLARRPKVGGKHSLKRKF